MRSFVEKGSFQRKNTAQDEPKNLVFHFVPGYLSIEPTSAEVRSGMFYWNWSGQRTDKGFVE